MARRKYKQEDTSREERQCERKDLSCKERIYPAKKAAYGYKIGTDKKKRAPVIDEEAAPIVRRIFEMYAFEISSMKIAEVLNKEGIRSPAVYAYSQTG